MKSRSRTPDATIRFLLNEDDTFVFPEYPEEEVETPRISNPHNRYVAISIPGERRIRRVPAAPWYEPRLRE